MPPMVSYRGYWSSGEPSSKIHSGSQAANTMKLWRHHSEVLYSQTGVPALVEQHLSVSSALWLATNHHLGKGPILIGLPWISPELYLAFLQKAGPHNCYSGHGLNHRCFCLLPVPTSQPASQRYLIYCWKFAGIINKATGCISGNIFLWELKPLPAHTQTHSRCCCFAVTTSAMIRVPSQCGRKWHCAMPQNKAGIPRKAVAAWVGTEPNHLAGGMSSSMCTKTGIPVVSV